MIHALELRLWLFKVPICLYRKPAMFAHKKKITGARGTLTTLHRTRLMALLHYEVLLSFLAFYGSPCIPPVLCGVFRTIVFLCLVYWLA